jgi:hypothetical protein
MSLENLLASESLRWGALCFVAEFGWNRSKRYRSSKQKIWLWALLFTVLALGQLTIVVLHHQEKVEVFAST